MNLDINQNAAFVLQQAGRVQEALVRNNWQTEWYDLWNTKAVVFFLRFLNEDNQESPEIRRQLLENHCKELAAHLDRAGRVWRNKMTPKEVKQKAIDDCAVKLDLKSVEKELQRCERSLLKALELNAWGTTSETEARKPSTP